MKNKIFELYKPDSLASFLEFYKSNPKEKFVYVLQHPAPNINVLSASEFGYLVICLPKQDNIIYSAAPFVRKMKKIYRILNPMIIFYVWVILQLLGYPQL